MIPAVAVKVIEWLSAIPDIIRGVRKVKQAIEEPDETRPNPNALTYKDVAHIRGQIDSATRHGLVSPKETPHGSKKPTEESPEKKALDPNPYSTDTDK